MARDRDTVWCDNCGVEILWAPIVAGTRDYCCEECHAGLPCLCGERLEVEERRRAEAKDAFPPAG